MRRVMADDRRRAVDAAMAHIPADGGAPSAADVARRAAVILRESGVDPGCPRVLAVNVRSRPDFQAALRAKRARADKGRALLAAADTPGWLIQRQSATSLAALASRLPASSGARAISDDVALVGGSKGGAAMVDEDTSCVAKPPTRRRPSAAVARRRP